MNAARQRRGMGDLLKQQIAAEDDDGAGEAAPPAEADAAPARPRKPSGRRTRPQPPGPAPEAAPELSGAELGRWRWQLGASARKAAAAKRRASESEQDWERLCTDAAAAGVPRRLIVAAASDADLPIPEPPE